MDKVSQVRTQLIPPPIMNLTQINVKTLQILIYESVTAAVSLAVEAAMAKALEPIQTKLKTLVTTKQTFGNRQRNLIPMILTNKIETKIEDKKQQIKKVKEKHDLMAVTKTKIEKISFTLRSQNIWEKKGKMEIARTSKLRGENISLIRAAGYKGNVSGKFHRSYKSLDRINKCYKNVTNDC
ncbi:UNVERIFIED_CONTAM: hypothetical protein K2H54_061483 [Gekko kuhli]